MSRSNKADKMTRRFQERNFKKAMQRDPFQRGFQLPIAMRETQETIEAGSLRKMADVSRADHLRRVDTAMGERAVLAIDSLGGLARAARHGFLYGGTVTGRMSARRPATTNQQASQEGREATLIDMEASLTLLAREMFPKVEFAFERFVKADKKLIAMPSPANLDKVKAERPEAYQALLDMAEMGGIEIMSDEECRRFPIAGSSSRQHDIVLSFRSEKDKSDIYAALYGMSQRYATDAVLPLEKFPEFCEQRCKRSPYVVSKNTAEQALQPVTRRVVLD